MIIKPFRPYRPVVDKVQQVAALPYDVMNTEEAKALVKDNPYSFLHIDKPEIHVTNPKKDELYLFAREKLREMVDAAIFFQEEEESFYIYGIKNQFTEEYGIVACASCEEYDSGKIKKHENTRADKELDRRKHVQYCKAQTGPIFLAYKGLSKLTDWMMEYVKKEAPLYCFVAEDSVSHVVYRVSDKETVEWIGAMFKQTNTLYIADGHHRAAAACSYARIKRQEDEPAQIEAEYNYFLATIFPKEQLYIMDYNRVLKDESNLTKEALFMDLEKIFLIESITDTVYKPNKRHSFGMRYKGAWYKLTLKEGIIEETDPVAALDVSILQDYVLEPLFHIENPREDKRIDFVGGIRGMEELNRRTELDMDIAFSMYPTSMDELIKVADAEKLMPPKSTWFEPKLRSGLFIHEIE